MELIGFALLMGIGIALVFVGVSAASVMLTFSGKVDWPSVIFFFGGGGALMWAAVRFFPIVVTWSPI